VIRPPPVVSEKFPGPGEEGRREVFGKNRVPLRAMRVPRANARPRQEAEGAAAGKGGNQSSIGSAGNSATTPSARAWASTR
jgi:hypothetical protein